MKKIFTAIICILLFMSVFVSCGNKTSKEEIMEKNEDEKAENEKAEEKQTEK